MSDKIKEILDRLEGRKNWYLHQQKNNGVFNDEDYMAYMLLDYITNLQQENEYLKKQNDEKTRIGLADHKYSSQMEDKVIELQQENERLKEWKKDLLNENIELENIRKEAIEYIKTQQVIFANYDIVIEEQLDNLLNILQNGSDSQ